MKDEVPGRDERANATRNPADHRLHLSQHQMNVIVQRAVKDLEQQEQGETSRPAGLPARSGPARNQPCYCGSGRKYKKCHEDPAGLGGKQPT